MLTALLMICGIRQGLYESKEGRYLELSQDRFKERSDEE